MKLSQMFSGQTQVSETMRREEAHSQQQTARNTASVNRQIRSLVPGQTISGEIVGRNGGEVQIRLADDMVLNARVDRSLNIEIGKNMTFEVKNNGSSLTLSPLFTNVATDVNVLKALDMAGLPVNGASVEMTGKLMEAGLPVNRNSLLQVYREVSSFPQAPISDIVDLHRLQMPVNEANLNQMASYRNLTHQLLQGMEAVTEGLSGVFDALNASGDAAGAVKLYQELFMLVQEGGLEASQQTDALAPAPEGAVSQETPVQGEAMQNTAAQEGVLPDGAGQSPVTGQEGINAANEQGLTPETNLLQPDAVAGMQSEAAVQGGQTAGEAAQAGMSAVPEALRAAVSEEVLSMLKNLPLTDRQMEEAVRQVKLFAAGETDVPQFLKAMNRLAGDIDSLQNMQRAGHSGAMGQNEAMLITEGQGRAMQALAGMFSQPSFKKLLNGQLKKMWTVSPREVAEPGKIEELYRRLDRQLKGLSNALESAGQADSAAYKAEI